MYCMAEDIKIVKNKLGIEILTPSGYQTFSGMSKIIRPQRVRLEFENGAWLECSANHPIKIPNGAFIRAINYRTGDIVESLTGLLKVTDVTYIEEQIELFDLLDVDGGNEYFTNGVVSHNCQFLSSEPLLINSLVLARLKGEQPIFEDLGFKFWYNISPKKTYLIGVDVSEGLSKDYSAIQVFEASTLTQIAEFRESTYSESQLYDKMKELFEYILKKRDAAGNQASIIWSYENNACGKVISTLYFNDMEFPEKAELISEGKKLGMNTSQSTKSEACSLFKRLVEGKATLNLKSEDLITELKTYVQNGSSGTYSAQTGGTDDLISACLIISRLVKHAASYDDEAFDRLYRGKVPETPLSDEVYDEQTPRAEDEPVPYAY